jgi:uncharacterized protein (DUF1778 family)
LKLNEKRGRGQPPKATKDKQSELMQFRVTKADRKLLEKAAGDKPLSRYMREVMVAHAKRKLK